MVCTVDKKSKSITGAIMDANECSTSPVTSSLDCRKSLNLFIDKLNQSDSLHL